MRSQSYLAGFGGAAFAVACLVIGLEVSATTAAPSAGQTTLTINRSLKSDRMPLIPVKSHNAVNSPAETNAPTGAPAPKPRLIDLCAPLRIAIAQSTSAQHAHI